MIVRRRVSSVRLSLGPFFVPEFGRKPNSSAKNQPPRRRAGLDSPREEQSRGPATCVSTHVASTLVSSLGSVFADTDDHVTIRLQRWFTTPARPGPYLMSCEVLLQLLYRLLSHIDETDEQMGILADVAVGLMFDVIEPLGGVLTTLPVGPEHRGRTAGPSFELFYQPDYLLPHRRAAWLIMSEHLADAAQLVQAQSKSDPRLTSVADALIRQADMLRTNAP